MKVSSIDLKEVNSSLFELTKHLAEKNKDIFF